MKGRVALTILVTLALVATPFGSGAAPAAPVAPSGVVWAWGDNDTGQLGNGNTADSRTPAMASGLNSVVAVAASVHSLAVLSDGTARAWGTNESGQLGNGGTTTSATPTPVSGLSGVAAVAGGSGHSLALLNDGTVRAWGWNRWGQLGDGGTADSGTPVAASGLGGVVAVAAGYNHSLALLNDGTVRAWGRNESGQLGNGSTADSRTPVAVSGLGGVVAIGAGGDYGLALLNDGTVRAWGNNANGQLGNGSTTNSATPVTVSGLRGVVAVAAGVYHGLALLNDGTARSWGENGYGQLGNGTTSTAGCFCITTPVQVSGPGGGGLSGIVALGGGIRHSVALTSSGRIWTWGDNRDGQLGNDSIANSPTPVPVGELAGVTAIAVGYYHNLAIVPPTGQPAPTPTPPPPSPSGPGQCFAETGKCVRDGFLAYWQTHGLELGDAGVSYRESLALFGYPLTDEFTQTLEDGQEYSVQYFERVRFEYHPETAPPDPEGTPVLLGQLGRRIRPADSAVAQQAGAAYFVETGHNLSGRFLAYWSQNGGLVQFGFPLSEEFPERLEDGQIYVVQYFERARLERHPENPPPYDVTLGQFGRRALVEAGVR